MENDSNKGNILKNLVKIYVYSMYAAYVCILIDIWYFVHPNDQDMLGVLQGLFVAPIWPIYLICRLCGYDTLARDIMVVYMVICSIGAFIYWIVEKIKSLRKP